MDDKEIESEREKGREKKQRKITKRRDRRN